MKVYSFAVPLLKNQVLLVEEHSDTTYHPNYHYHAELQLNFVISGNGNVLVDNSFSSFSENDIIMIGSNTPHQFNSIDAKEGNHIISIYFDKAIIPENFETPSEFRSILQLFKQSKRGLKFSSFGSELGFLFHQINSSSEHFERYLILLKILSLLIMESYEEIATNKFRKEYHNYDGEKIKKVIDLTLNEFHRKITLDEVAELSNLSVGAFCKYFKRRTSKTFIHFLNEVRINNACLLLIGNKELSVSEIAYNCGFTNPTVFNRTFKKYKNMTPLNYRRLTTSMI